MNSVQQQPAQGGINNEPPNTVNQGATGMINQQNFGQFPQQQMMHLPQSLESDGFANFSSVQSPSQFSRQQSTDQTQKNDVQIIPSQMQHRNKIMSSQMALPTFRLHNKQTRPQNINAISAMLNHHRQVHQVYLPMHQ